MNNAIKSADFFKAGHATFTVTNPAGRHYTYIIKRPKGKDVFFASLTNAREDYIYLGVYNPDQARVIPTRNTGVPVESETFTVLNWAIRTVTQGAELKPGYAIQHVGKCCACGRPLTHPESIESGMGPECSGKKYGKAKRRWGIFAPKDAPAMDLTA